MEFFKKILPQKLPLSPYLNDTIEFGFSQYGPTLGLSGTIGSPDKVCLIYEIALVAISRRESDIQHHFTWFAFRPQQFTNGGLQGIDFKMANKFMVTPQQKHMFNILFSDQEHYTRIRTTLHEIRSEWQERVSQASDPPTENDFQNFLTGNELQEKIAWLTHLCYWKDDTYTLHVLFVTEKKQTYQMRRLFQINPEHVQTMRANTAAIVADACKQRHTGFNYITVPLKV